MKTYRLDTGRLIRRGEHPFVYVGRDVTAPPTDVDQFARDIVRAMNHIGALRTALADLLDGAAPDAATAALAAYDNDKGHEYE